MSIINIKNADKAEVLAALYNRGRVQGMGFLQARPGDMTKEQAQSELDGIDKRWAEHTTTPKRDRRHYYFDYLHGRVMKVDLTGDVVEPALYDRDNGQGACARALEGVRGVVLEQEAPAPHGDVGS